MGWAGRQENIRPPKKCFFLDSFYRTYQDLACDPSPGVSSDNGPAFGLRIASALQAQRCCKQNSRSEKLMRSARRSVVSLLLLVLPIVALALGLTASPASAQE